MKPTFHLEKQNALHSFNNSSPFLEIGKKKKKNAITRIFDLNIALEKSNSLPLLTFISSLSLSLSLFSLVRKSLIV